MNGYSQRNRRKLDKGRRRHECEGQLHKRGVHECAITRAYGAQLARADNDADAFELRGLMMRCDDETIWEAPGRV